MGFQPNQTLKLLSNPFLQPRACPKPISAATAAQAQPPSSQQQNKKMASKLGGTLDRKLQSEAKNAAVSVCRKDARYLGRMVSLGCLEAIRIAGLDKDLSVCSHKSRLGR